MKENFFPKLKKTQLAEDILEKFISNQEKISEILKEFATKWDFQKQNPIDITILELLLTEILYLEYYTAELESNLTPLMLIKLDNYMKTPYYLNKKNVRKNNKPTITMFDQKSFFWFRMNNNDVSSFLP